MTYSRFETEIPVQPRDIDIHKHVHHSVYLDYLLAARFDQMARCYGMSMDEFNQRGLTWFARKYTIAFKSPVAFGDTVIVRTWIETVGRASVDVGFEIDSKQTGRQAAKGVAGFVLMDMERNRPAKLSEDIIQQYSI